LILAVLDIIHEIKTLEEGIFWTMLAVIWNIIEIVPVVGYIAELFNLPFGLISVIPFIGFIGMFGIGVFFILGNIMWIYFYIKH